MALPKFTNVGPFHVITLADPQGLSSPDLVNEFNSKMMLIHLLFVAVRRLHGGPRQATECAFSLVPTCGGARAAEPAEPFQNSDHPTVSWHGDQRASWLAAPSDQFAAMHQSMLGIHGDHASCEHRHQCSADQQAHRLRHLLCSRRLSSSTGMRPTNCASQ